eukprot:COSAG03_NODE_24073_length_275_cov_0.573864_2_plen_39_part_01
MLPIEGECGVELDGIVGIERRRVCAEDLEALDVFAQWRI